LSEADAALGRLDTWLWRRHGEETLRAREEENPLDRIEAEGEAKAFEEACKYVQAGRERGGVG
jgi:hypothetical protein